MYFFSLYKLLGKSDCTELLVLCAVAQETQILLLCIYLLSNVFLHFMQVNIAIESPLEIIIAKIVFIYNRY